MRYAGLDVGNRTTAICVMDSVGNCLLETSVTTTPAAIAAALKRYRRTLSKVGQETGPRAFWLHRELAKLRFPMVCLDARYAHAALGAQPNKTDKADAQGLATLLVRGIYTAVYVKSDQSIRTHALLSTRQIILRKAVSLQVSIDGVRRALGAEEGPKRRRTMVARKRTRSYADPVDSFVRSAYRAIDALMAEVAVLEGELKDIAAEDPVCRRLMTIPGVGPLTAVTFRSVVDDPSRFSSRTVGAYFGLTPRRYQSGEINVSGRISKRGDTDGRTALYQAAVTLLNVSKTTWWLRTWGLKLAKKKGFKCAATACARKLAVAMHKLWISGEEFGVSADAREKKRKLRAAPPTRQRSVARH